MIIVFFITGIILLVMVFTTYQIKSKAVRWLFILIPPISLLSLIWIPLDRGTEYLWLPAILAAFFSLGSIVVKLIAALAHRTRTGKMLWPSLVTRLIRPILVVCIMCGLRARERLSIRCINVYAVQLAKEIQETYDPNEICPEAIKGWEISENDPWLSRCFSEVKKYGRKSTIRYENSKYSKEFKFIVRHNVYVWFTVSGGVDKDLRARLNDTVVDINELVSE
ncbi:MAG: hypothetical protein ACYTFW_22785 [Planctomycetota bacterium]|jgi:hypothetical protein